MRDGSKGHLSSGCVALVMSGIVIVLVSGGRALVLASSSTYRLPCSKRTFIKSESVRFHVAFLTSEMATIRLWCSELDSCSGLPIFDESTTTKGVEIVKFLPGNVSFSNRSNVIVFFTEFLSALTVPPLRRYHGIVASTSKLACSRAD